MRHQRLRRPAPRLLLLHQCTKMWHPHLPFRYKSLINSETISVSKKYRNILAGHINSKNIVRMKLQTLQILQIFIECRIMVGGASEHKSKHSLSRLKITVGCRLCTYPSIHPSPGAGTLKITVGCLTSTNPSIRNKNLQTCWTPWSTGNTRAVGTSTRAVACACACASDPQPRLFELTSL